VKLQLCHSKPLSLPSSYLWQQSCTSCLLRSCPQSWLQDGNPLPPTHQRHLLSGCLWQSVKSSGGFVLGRGGSTEQVHPYNQARRNPSGSVDNLLAGTWFWALSSLQDTTLLLRVDVWMLRELGVGVEPCDFLHSCLCTSHCSGLFTHDNSFSPPLYTVRSGYTLSFVTDEESEVRDARDS
jgi:hypothetical protein